MLAAQKSVLFALPIHTLEKSVQFAPYINNLTGKRLLVHSNYITYNDVDWYNIAWGANIYQTLTDQCNEVT